MNKLILVPIALLLSGCVGTTIMGREYEKDKPYPDLHSVPDRPAEINFKAVDKEIQYEEDDQAAMLKFNQQLRSQYIKP